MRDGWWIMVVDSGIQWESYSSKGRRGGGRKEQQRYVVMMTLEHIEGR